MTKTLILIRHAKSDWGDPILDDHDRPLNARGRAAAPRIGTWLRQHPITLNAALVSTARRTRETWDLIAAQLPQAPRPTFLPDLYHASPDTLWKRIQDATADALCLVGHNPGIGSLAAQLGTTVPDHPKFDLYPTGATLILQFATEEWAHAQPGTGQLIAFTTPRDLH